MKRVLVLTDKLDNMRNPTNGMRVYGAMRHLGYQVALGDHRTRSDKLNGYDLILALGTMLYPDRVDHMARIAKSKPNGAILALWYFDACNPAFLHSKHKAQAMKKAIPHLDWLIMTDASYPWWEQARNYLHLMQGVDPDDFRWGVHPYYNRERDVIFTGGFRGAFYNRERMLSAIGKRFSLVVYGRDSGRRVYGKAFFEAYQQARVAFVPPPPRGVGERYWSNRVYLAAATGTPCVVGYVDGLKDHFGDDVLYFNNTKTMIGAIRHLLSHPVEAKEMGLRARARVLRDHTYAKRVEELMEVVFG